MVKRKAEGDLPDTISMQPLIEPSSPGRSPPFAVYFASGYQPGDKDRTQWEVHTSTTRRNQHLLIATLVRKPEPFPSLRCMQTPAGHWKAVPVPAAPAMSFTEADPPHCSLGRANTLMWILWAPACRLMHSVRQHASAPLLSHC